MFNLTHTEAVAAAAKIAARQGFGVVVQRRFDGLCYASAHHPGNDLSLSTPFDASGAALSWAEAWAARRALAN